MPSTKTRSERRYWGKIYRQLPALDLLAVQKTSYVSFLEKGISNLLQEISPISDFTGKNWELRFGQHFLGEASRTPEETMYKDLSYDFPLNVEATLVNKRTGNEVKERVFLGDLPKMTKTGTFIINGIERAVVNQIVRSPGIFFGGEVDAASGKRLYKAEVRPLRGSWLEFEIGRSEVMSVRIDRRRRFAATTFLRALGLGTDEEIWAALPNLQEESRRLLQITIDRDPSKSSQEALVEIYQKMRPGEPVILENAAEFIRNMFFDGRRYDLGRVGRFKINKRLGLAADEGKRTLRLEDVLATVRYLSDLQAGIGGRVDDIDHLANRRIRQVGELVAESAFRIGLLRLERAIKEKMSLFSPEDKVGPAQLINARPVIAAINEFFRSNQLSAILDQTNPLSEVDNLRRVSVMGTGGISRERASFSVRDINASQYGRICPVRTPEGQNIGLVTYLSLYTRVNEYGFLETPYLKVKDKRVTDEIVYLAADDEQEHYITHQGVKIDEQGYLQESWVPVRFGGEFLEEKREKVEYVDVIPWQVVGTSASLIPFLDHDMANRALLGTHMQCQAVPLVKPEAPIVGTGMERVVAEAMGRVVRAEKAGKVTDVDGSKVVVKSGRQEKVYPLFKFKRTNPYSTCFSQRAAVAVGDKIEQGQLLIDGPACDQGELALGRNLLIAYGSFGGLEYEDAIVISDRLVKEEILTSISIDEHEAAVVETKLGPEELTRDIPNVSEGDLRNLAEDGIVVVGSEVGPNDILVGKIAPKGETELTAEERLLRAIFGEKAREVRDTSLRMPHGEHGTVIEVQILDRDKGDELEAGTIKKVIIRVAQLRKIGVGDKLAGRHGNKGVISKVVSLADMPYLPDGTPVDIVISPLAVLARMNLGQLLEAHLGWAAQKLGYKVALPVFDKTDEGRIVEELKKAGLPTNGKITLRDGRTGEPYETESVVGVAYILKLVHMVDDKTHARSTGPYSLITQQPLGGKAQMGGQRLGEMEVWALEAHRAAHTLQEMLTVKSDDVGGRAKTFEAIVKGTEIPEATVPESFNVLNRELNSLALEVIPTNKVETPEEKANKLVDFAGLKIKLASPEVIKSWSHGEVTKPETINYRTLKAEKDGLFSESIFGPTKDWECYCGKYKRIRYKGIICDKCGVEVTQSRVRRERMGHIQLSAPVAHVWFFKGAPSKISLLLDLPPKSIEAVVYFAQYLVTEVDETGKKEARQRLEKDLGAKRRELENQLVERVRAVEKEAKEEEKTRRIKVKSKEQLVLALEEIKLKTKQKIQAMKDENLLEVERAEEIYQTIMGLVGNLQVGKLLTEEENLKLVEYGVAGFFKAGMGAEVLLEIIKKMDLEKLAADLREKIKESSGPKYLKLSKRLRLVEGMRKAGTEPSWMILRVLPVIPPDLRPMVQLSGGRFATSDLNDLYRRVINRNNRLKHLIALGAPEIILRNEKRMLQEAVDSLIDVHRRLTQRSRRQVRPLRSLSEMLRGKQGRFRQNLLGKRVDYSGRSVIVVGPELRLNQCGLPKEMALEMFKPFVLHELIVNGIAPNVKSAKYALEHRPPEIFDILEKITKDHPVLLNRAPTLHKLGIQAFYPLLIEGNAIQIHPCVCAGFNADFDGDQMAVHVPLSQKSQEEAARLMSPASNLLKPSSGEPINTPDKEMALGCYFVTSADEQLPSVKTIFADKDEAILAFQTGKIELRRLIKVRYQKKMIETTVGRLLFNEILPKEMVFINESIKQRMIKSLITQVMQKHEWSRVIEFIDALKGLGFWGSTISGLSVGVWDCQIYPKKGEIIRRANQQATKIQGNFIQGLITQQERKRLVQELWLETTQLLADKTWAQFGPKNSIFLMVEAGLRRVSKDGVKQISAMQGLVVDPLGKIVELPIKANFREGLSIFEYLTSARGARKGLTDTAIKTSDAGYLTRRLVDAVHDVLIRSEDCQTKQGVKISRQGQRGEKFGERILGRFLAKDVTDSRTKKILFKRQELLDEEAVKKLDKAGVPEVWVRSALTCELKYGLCAKCYGWDFSRRAVAEVGTPVGVIAAQSIGEPGTQLTLRTKQTGGIVGLDVTQGLPRVEELFEARSPKTLSPLAEIAGKVSIKETESGYQVKITSLGVKPFEEREYLVSGMSQLKVEKGQLVEAGAQLAAGSLDVREILQVRGLLAAQEYLAEEIQLVYESQGVPINDRHIEVVVRRMSDKVRIETPGDTHFLSGELVSKTRFEEENQRVLAEGGEPATARIVILGLTRSSLFTESWLSAASFQETTNVLTDASLEGREDRLLGLKENVIIGRLIPVMPERAILYAHS